MAFHDLASLTKCLVTAPLALMHLDLDVDRREQLGFSFRQEPLTVRQLLSHSSGLPPWLPFTGEPLGEQLSRGFPCNAHPLFQKGEVGVSLYSDLGYRLLAELLEMEQGGDWRDLGRELTGLESAPWLRSPVSLPDGQDVEAWMLAEPGHSPVPQSPGQPHDANARSGMKGHAGFGADPKQLKAWLEKWVAMDFPGRMAVRVCDDASGRAWGLGLHALVPDLVPLLQRVPPGLGGVHVLEDAGQDGPESLDLPKGSSETGSSETGSSETGFWMMRGYTGPALFVRPQDGCVIALLVNRLGPGGALLDAQSLHFRRARALMEWVQR